jgi:hypothetical protein
MSIFKKCTCCNNPWLTREEFLSDNQLDFVGYQVNFANLELGYFLFNHLLCQSTIAIPAGLFRDLYDGPVFAERKTNLADCPGYCDDREALDLCGTECECAYIREVIQIVRRWPKTDCPSFKIAQGQCRA